jgi:predicted membrane protein
MNNKQNFSEGNLILGAILILIGGVALLNALDIRYQIPSWLLRWEYIPIAAGIYSGSKRNFGAPYSWLIPIAVGVIFLIGAYTSLDVWRIAIPLGLMSAGFIVLTGAFGKNAEKKNINQSTYENNYSNTSEHQYHEYTDVNTDQKSNTNFSAEPINSTTENATPQFVNIRGILGGVTQTISSKAVAGGDITVIMGGAELNFLDADIKAPIVINLTLLMGGTTLIVPSNWKIKNEITAIIGGIEDRRMGSGLAESNEKVVTLKGTAIMGGVEIKSFR